MGVEVGTSEGGLLGAKEVGSNVGMTVAACAVG